MAEFVGAHVEMGIAVKAGGSELFHPIWSETIALGGTTTQEAAGAPTLKDITVAGTLVFRVRAQSAGPIFVAKGKTPDATKAVSTAPASARAHLLASEKRDFPAAVGDKITIVSAA
ncbi:hypothetical protein [Rhizobium sp. Leaf383]|uniref:hypothetical protein n=1 Tax=Rhizobium sp. Leaf383 TaxID=1736357 RepID=UPI00071408C7|nr:hypothetical protein [Rhizobium sp. Leaf383]KQS84266.1 hypothetical protein ASG58_21080 [Rhizobium sp. Leaf383]